MVVPCSRRLALAVMVALTGSVTVPGAPRPRRAAPPPPVVAPAPAASATVPAGRSPRNANYSIDVELDPSSHTLIGREVLTWRNTTARPATDLRFHLYYNAWSNTESTWMREARRAGGSRR